MLWKKKKIRKKVRTTEVNKIVTVVLKKDDISYADEAYQWNYGQILRIQGGNLPKVVEVHFSLEETSGTSVTRIGTTVDGVTEVPIPDSHLENNNCSQDYTIYAYIYLEDGTAGRTEYEIAIPVKARTKPEVPGTPEEPELFRETVKAVNDAADRAEQAEQNAKASATEAGKYAANASESAAAAEKTKEELDELFMQLGEFQLSKEELNGRHISLRNCLEQLGQRGLDSVLIEGGATIHAAALQENCCDLVQVYVAPKLFGGDGLSPIGGMGITAPDKAVLLSEPTITRLGQDLLLEYTRKEQF